MENYIQVEKLAQTLLPIAAYNLVLVIIGFVEFLNKHQPYRATWLTICILSLFSFIILSSIILK